MYVCMHASTAIACSIIQLYSTNVHMIIYRKAWIACKVELLFSIIIVEMPMKVIQPPHGVQQDNLNITMKK
jgi:hypothetical protein